jgi:hypothetical protein
MLDVVTAETFTPHVGSTFTVEPDASTRLPIELVSVSALGGAATGANAKRRTPFSLVFRGARTPVLPQQIYRLVHESLGVLDMFLVPIGPDQVGMQYEAIFS